MPLARRLRFLPLLIGACWLAPAVPARADFDPAGRKKPRPARTVKKPARPRPPAPADRRPDRAALIERYRAIVLAQPGAVFPLQRLTQLVRERDGSLEALLAELGALVAEGGDRGWAAQVALGGVLRLEGKAAEARAALEAAAAARPRAAAPRLALGRMALEAGQRGEARAQLTAALGLLEAGAEREALLRELMGLALDDGDVAAARAHHAELVKAAEGSFQVRAELGRELLARGRLEAAVEELGRVVQAVRGDPRAAVPVLRDLGQAELRAGRRAAGVATLRRALTLASGQPGLRRDILRTLLEGLRGEPELPPLLAELEREQGDADLLVLLGGAREELGQTDQAFALYQRGAARAPGHRELGLRLVRLLVLRGDLDGALARYDILVRAAPRDTELWLRRVELLLEQGNRARALEELGRLEAQARGDEDTLSVLVELYERLGEGERAARVLERLAGDAATDPRHLVELGARQWRAGQKDRARATWERLRGRGDAARTAELLAETFVEHELFDEALAELTAALARAPGSRRLTRALALASERAAAAAREEPARRAHAERAATLWEELSRDPDGRNVAQAREARSHLVTLWALGRRLEPQAAALRRRLEATPPDVAAGRLLVDVLLRSRRHAEAERVLARLTELTPGEVELFAMLERVAAQQGRLEAAAAAVERQLQLDPGRARDYHQRLAQYAAERYRDDEALRHAEQVVALAPEDAEAHRRVAAIHLRRQDRVRAQAALRQAIAHDDRLHVAYLELAELLVAEGDVDGADGLLARVVRTAPTDELVTAAARARLQLHTGRGTLGRLEQELLPVALANPRRATFRRLLVDLYAALTPPLVAAAAAPPPAGTAPRQQLLELGARAAQPLLATLAEEHEDRQRLALELLDALRPRAAGPALVAFARGPASAELRARAAWVAASLDDPALTPRLVALVEPRPEAGSPSAGVPAVDDLDPVVVAAAFGLARRGTAGALPTLERLLGAEGPALRLVAAWGLGRTRQQRHAPRLLALAGEADQPRDVRAAALLGLGELGPGVPVAALGELARSGDTVVRGAALVALARVDAAAALGPVAAALLSPDARLAEAGRIAALAATHPGFAVGPLEPGAERPDPSLLARPAAAPGSVEQRARALVRLAPALAREAPLLASSSPGTAEGVAAALFPGQGRLGAGPLQLAAVEGEPALRAEVEAALHGAIEALVPALLPLAEHAEAEVRARAIAALCHPADARAAEAVLGALHERAPRVVEAALACPVAATAPAVPALLPLLAAHAAPWPLRRRAAELVGRAAGDDARALGALVAAAEHDPQPLVREVAARGAARARLPAALATRLARVAATDPEPRVRAAAGGTP